MTGLTSCEVRGLARYSVLLNIAIFAVICNIRRNVNHHAVVAASSEFARKQVSRIYSQAKAKQ